MGSTGGDESIVHCGEIVRELEQIWAPDIACDWDNVGLLIGDKHKEVKTVMLALDATDDVIRQAIEQHVDMLITHHPLIFSGMKRITADHFIGRRVLQLIQHEIAYYAMHTNFDVRGMATEAAARLGLSDCQVLEYTGEMEQTILGIGQVGNLPSTMTLQECADKVKRDFELDYVRVFGDLKTKVKTLAVSPGSGKSEIANARKAGADVLVTGDIDHHDGMDAVAQGLTIIDAGHYGLEYIFSDYMEHFLQEKLDQVLILKAKEAAPFLVL
jgi:dinuclear metal center YbgI/SA1388 family protein